LPVRRGCARLFDGYTLPQFRGARQREFSRLKCRSYVIYLTVTGQPRRDLSFRR
jgi:hypothetical protein